MSMAPSQQSSTDAARATPEAVVQGIDALEPTDKFLLDLGRLDLSHRFLDREGIARWNPHRDQMALLDAIVWKSRDNTQGVAVKHIRDDEFWVSGHFPARAMFPGVLMVESGAQLGSFLFNIRQETPTLAAFLRIDKAVFRRAVEPGDDLYLLCREVKFQKRRFVSDIQGVVDGQLCFEAQITGMNMGPMDPGA